MRTALPILFLTLSLAACGKPAEQVEAPTAPASPAPASVPAPQPEHAIPAVFLGRWDTDGGVCGTSDRENPLVLEPARVRFYESSGDVTAVRGYTHGIRSVFIDVIMSGEGEEWSATLNLVVSEDGATLTMSQAGVEPAIRHRCQPEGQAQ